MQHLCVTLDSQPMLHAHPNLLLLFTLLLFCCIHHLLLLPICVVAEQESVQNSDGIAGFTAGADQDRHDSAVLHAADNARGSLHGANVTFWQHRLPLSHGFFHPNAQGQPPFPHQVHQTPLSTLNLSSFTSATHFHSASQATYLFACNTV